MDINVEKVPNIAFLPDEMRRSSKNYNSLLQLVQYLIWYRT